jgi:hypothetical protein
VEILENVYAIITASKIMYRIEVWGLEEAQRENDKTHGRCCKKLIQVSRSAVNCIEELEFG